MAITILRDKSSLTEYVAALRAAQTTLALVPTMGALHEGHMSLVHQARQLCDTVIGSIFVNPMQFGPREDFAAYPRDEASDIAKLEAAGAAAVYLPRVDEMYPQGFSTVVYVKGISEDLCGAMRPGHFDGVCTIVSKLFMQMLPDAALFGEKDYQQLQVVRRMVRDLDIPVMVRGCTTIREPDGLAMSSRNAYLSADERRIASMLYKTLTRVSNKLLETHTRTHVALDWGIAQLLQAGFNRVDYLELRDAETLAPVEEVRRPARLLAAAHLGRTRLIDNLAVLP